MKQRYELTVFHDDGASHFYIVGNDHDDAELIAFELIAKDFGIGYEGWTLAWYGVA